MPSAPCWMWWEGRAVRDGLLTYPVETKDKAILKRTIVVAKVIKPHGIHGGVKVKPYTEDYDGFPNYDIFFVEEEGSTVPIRVERMEPHNGFFLVYFEGVESIEVAEKLRDKLLTVNRETVVEKKGLEQDEVLIDDLIGYGVYVEGGEYLGYVEGYYAGGVSGIYLVKSGDPLSAPDMEIALTKKKMNDRDFFIPCEMDYYQRVDFEQRRIYLFPHTVLR